MLGHHPRRGSGSLQELRQDVERTGHIRIVVVRMHREAQPAVIGPRNHPSLAQPCLEVARPIQSERDIPGAC